ncbi:MAG: hypothetical protein NZ699_08445 [Roseiflexus sp.]|nr:hypothetical protein [Roseiflexus sp.]MDW8145238.1 hypothetical protein [Roseiflexaceae bacterium]MDW8234397.1 hypothetical protein [Roseiflexaceae bacterium]
MPPITLPDVNQTVNDAIAALHSSNADASHAILHRLDAGCFT